MKLVRLLAKLAEEKKAREPTLLDVRKVTSYADYVLILSASSDRHARALADHVQREAKNHKVKPLGVEGMDTGQWILLDYGGVIVHVLQEMARDYYDLDGLWIDAEKLDPQGA